MRQLVFVHGRAQEKKNAAALKQQWITAWEEGLKKHGLTNPLDPKDIRFPYYGDTLHQMTKGKSGDQAADVIIKGPAPRKKEQAIMREMFAEIAAHEGVSNTDIQAELSDAVIEKGPLNWGWVRGIMTALDKVRPLSSKVVALVTADVAKYLSDPAVFLKINRGVGKSFAPGQEAVVVSHSLGTVVAYSVLMSRPEAFAATRIPLLVTLGSPLAVNAIKSRIRPHTFPVPVDEWYNAMDPNDAVSLYPLNKKHFPTGGTIENHAAVDNHTGNQHGIEGYLDDAEVAKRIYDAVTA